MSPVPTPDPTTVASEVELPAGTVVSFKETTPTQLTGYQWQGVSFSITELVIGSDEEVEVVATNFYEPTEVEPPSPTPDPEDPQSGDDSDPTEEQSSDHTSSAPTSSSSQLSKTGATVTVASVAALALGAVGLALVLRSRRTRK